MTILIVSPDGDAAAALSAALGRAGHITLWEQDSPSGLQRIRELSPPVVVADKTDDRYEELVDEVRSLTPWARIYLMADPSDAGPQVHASVVTKPFDASQLAEVLGREVELAQAELGSRELQARGEELAMLVEASFEAIIGLAEDGTILSWNHGASAMYGYEAAEIVGLPIGTLELEDTEQPRPPPGGTRQIRERRRRKKSGEELVVLQSVSPVSRKSARNLSFAEVSLDITARRKLERELEHKERLAEIGRLAASMAHEINNPLAVIHACTAYIAELAERGQDKDLAESAADMGLAVERIGGFVRHVCGFARRDRPHLEDTSLPGTLDLALRMVRPRAKERGVSVEVLEVSTARVPHDPPRVAQAIVNVVANAVDAASEGGHHVKIRIESDGRLAQVVVEDDGPGIARDIQDQVFEPFATTKPHGEGTGLGLAITRQIISDHGGGVSLESLDTGGARAVLSLKVLDPSLKHILVVDGDPAVRRALSTDLKRHKFNVTTASNLAGAREHLAEQAADVIVTDERVADGAGDELLAALEEASSGAPCLVVSGGGAIAGKPNRAHPTIQKPWVREELVAAVRRLCVEAK